MFTADCCEKKIKAIVKGPNACGFNGFKIETNENFFAENGHIVELLHGIYRYKVEFDSESTSNVKPNSSKQKCNFADDNVAKKMKTRNDLTTSKTPKPTSEETMKMLDARTLYVYTSKGVTSSKKVLIKMICANHCMSSL